ncbi:acyl-CoA dehydrogenase family protein [uncultured Martelella sp.]|uniref:acyl-CoA dehydrogenase family protein n=1 Tax=uncultured Martelella sp. TaxID=392331 RepID=UPI0029C78BDC|nr:acyl-CoA dehydrogenase family protein [uncultured Martelella sp.]
MTEFKAPVEDILFSLDAVAGASRLPDWDGELAGEIIGHFAAFAEGVLAPLNAVGDAEGCRLVGGRVIMPEGFRDAFAQLAEGGWQGLTAPEDFGGMGLSPVIGAAVSEIFSGANHAMQMVCGLVPGAIATLLHYGSEDQQQRWIAPLSAGAALSTMCLTEPDAGSDLGRIRTKASRDGDVWRLSGEKIFISGGDQDLSDNILHLVLARTGDAASGVRGLSLFLCDRESAGETIKITRIEEKLGLHASPTCQMVFDATPAELIGTEGEGLKAMFTVMNHARIDVALQGTAHAARAGHIAASYADERRQGRKADGSPAVLSDHADVRRMLDEQQALALGSRAMCHIALVEMALGEKPELVDFLTPVCKLFASEAGIKAANLGIQVLGGYGYLTEYGLSQVWRDARITAIYEGANGIHALTIAGRGLRLKDGAGADAFTALIDRLADGDTEIAALAQIWNQWRDKVLAAEDPTPLAHDFARLTATLYYRAVWSRIAAAGASGPDTAKLRRLKDHVLAAPLPVRLP